MISHKAKETRIAMLEAALRSARTTLENTSRWLYDSRPLIAEIERINKSLEDSK